MKAPAPARRRSRAPARAPGAARESASSFRASGGPRRAPRAPPQVTRGRPRRASREGPGRGRGRACVYHDSWSREVGRGRGATDASAGGSSAQQRSRDAAAAAARPCGKGPGDFAFDGVRAAAGRDRKAASPDCASGATSAGVTLGGSGAAVRARLGGGSAIGQGTRTRNGLDCGASGAGRWSRRAGAAHRSRGVLRLRRQRVTCVRLRMARCSAASEMGTSMLRAGCGREAYAGRGLLGAATDDDTSCDVSRGLLASVLRR